MLKVKTNLDLKPLQGFQKQFKKCVRDSLKKAKVYTSQFTPPKKTGALAKSLGAKTFNKKSRFAIVLGVKRDFFVAAKGVKKKEVRQVGLTAFARANKGKLKIPFLYGRLVDVKTGWVRKKEQPIFTQFKNLVETELAQELKKWTK